MSTPNRISKVAVVGAGGNVGRFITEAILNTGKHSVTALTRVGSQTTLPEGVAKRAVDYDKQETLVEALRGHDALVITVNGQAAVKDIQEQLVKAAEEAGVHWILPNEWSPDSTHEGILKDLPLFQVLAATRKRIEQGGKSSYVALVTGMWYEWSLAIPQAYGFDFANRKVTLFDNGETKLSTSTWPQVGRAVASLLSLPIKPEGSNEASLEDFKNKVVYVNSFTVSQNDMLASVLRVTGTKEADWTITQEPSQQRFAEGLQQMQEGNHKGFVKWLYTRIFFRDGCGDFEHSKGVSNQILGLPNEDIDEATNVAIERQKSLGEH
ncbi:hypothetical protein HDU87_007192 [Geranomyces variabilis]|uniref:NmrA-like domain-containing protein n=1 Tax=Geranomyces variabilis TaxID=109894 RepID=A0AAD5TFS9_9FUNG|nr:hypothetical protein HDU87_007192 [Geranomyces variabilis]